MACCILLSTCDRYRRYAEITARLIDERWHDHPPIFFSGCSDGKDISWLPLSDHPADWMGITRSAIRDLAKKGFDQCYLILDDHPPLFRCHSKHLNETLPSLMRELEAVFIGLNGWGQSRPVTGAVCGKKYYKVENVAADFLWKFQLHPALWDLSKFDQVLSSVMATLPDASRSPWAFERRAGAADGVVADDLKRRCYRICGGCMTASKLRLAFVSVERFLLRGVCFLAGRIGGREAWDKVDQYMSYRHRYYEGPYPLIWSGLVKRGRPNEELLRLLRWHFMFRFRRFLIKTSLS